MWKTIQALILLFWNKAPFFFGVDVLKSVAYKKNS